jgi:hypothetical protein
MESVSPHTRLVIGARQAEAARGGTHCPMKRGIETCDLRHVRASLAQHCMRLPQPDMWRRTISKRGLTFVTGTSTQC